MGAAKRIALGEEQIHLIAKALADPRRFELLRRIGGCSTPVACGTIKECHPVSGATLSHHMKEFEVAGLVRAAREGKFVSSTLRRDVLQACMEQLGKI
jgi:ArsR family transcriptional regulator, arsenate/arsenite/antimonite-responsive transcriptional repressor